MPSHGFGFLKFVSGHTQWQSCHVTRFIISLPSHGLFISPETWRTGSTGPAAPMTSSATWTSAWPQGTQCCSPPASPACRYLHQGTISALLAQARPTQNLRLLAWSGLSPNIAQHFCSAIDENARPMSSSVLARTTSVQRSCAQATGFITPMAIKTP